MGAKNSDGSATLPVIMILASDFNASRIPSTPIYALADKTSYSFSDFPFSSTQNSSFVIRNSLFGNRSSSFTSSPVTAATFIFMPCFSAISIILSAAAIGLAAPIFVISRTLFLTKMGSKLSIRLSNNGS